MDHVQGQDEWHGDVLGCYLPWSVELFASGRDDIGICTSRRGLGSGSVEVGVELVALLDRARVGDLYVRAKGFELNAVLRQQCLVLSQAVHQIALGNTLFPSPRWLGWHNAAVDAGLDTIGTWLLLVTSHLALLAQDAAMAASDLDKGRRIRIRWGIGNRSADRSGLVVG
ncbi:hypothetical protein RRF57_012132 [Xylaria bambusicola]|uniref:Uncharacterized protein n=1 Tax=Xylaria bambusicola TaxID=326684 RepID=A0AAN7UP18_9PEZI